jgi:3-phosphoshikimate 1-carboxyvinyltransferase
MKANLSYKNKILPPAELTISGSKSESNRALVLQALFPKIRIENLSDGDDTRYIQKGLEVNQGVIDVRHAGTAMRFLTAYFATQEGKIITLTGSERMQKRPISVLVDALRELGAQIEYVGESGFPPLEIQGRAFNKNVVTVNASVSSQYISALMLVAPSLTNGLNIELNNELISAPYVKMTASLLNGIGLHCSFNDSTISIKKGLLDETKSIVVESDWTSASYYYSLVAISENMSIVLKSFERDSHQGDRELVDVYRKLGVETTFIDKDKAIKLSKIDQELPRSLELNLVHTPDLAQTIAVSCFALGVECKLHGLKSLRIKETDRLRALKSELEKLGGRVEITDDHLKLFTRENINNNVSIKTYDDHRMAMAFAPLGLIVSLQIEDCEVVSKSYPSYWEDMASAGLDIDFQ